MLEHNISPDLFQDIIKHLNPNDERQVNVRGMMETMDRWMNGPTRPSQASLLFHAWLQGCLMGFSEFGSLKHNSYSHHGPWRWEWINGFVTGRHYWEYEKEILTLQRKIETLQATIDQHTGK